MFLWMVQLGYWSMFCEDRAIERLVHVFCGWCHLRYQCMFCVHGAIERLVHGLCGWCN